MKERWKQIENFEDYEVSNLGRIRSSKFGWILALNENQSGLIQVGLMRDGEQKHRSVPLLVAKAFIPQPSGPFDTPINLDGDRHNNCVDNLVWRPRWFAVKYNHQFRYLYDESIDVPLEDLKTGEITIGSLATAKRYGLLEKDLILSILNNTYVWPTYQQFRIVEE